VSENFVSTVGLLNPKVTVEVPPEASATEATLGVVVSPAGAATPRKNTVPLNPLRLVRVPVTRLEKLVLLLGMSIVVGVTDHE